MLKSYEAIFEHGQLRWLEKQPQIPEGAQVIVIVESGAEPMLPKSSEDVRKVLHESWGAWGTGKTMDEIDREIEEMRLWDWEREWENPDQKSRQ